MHGSTESGWGWLDANTSAVLETHSRSGGLGCYYYRGTESYYIYGYRSIAGYTHYIYDYGEGSLSNPYAYINTYKRYYGYYRYSYISSYTRYYGYYYYYYANYKHYYGYYYSGPFSSNYYTYTRSYLYK